MHCANTCGGSQDKFMEDFVGAADHYRDQYDLPQGEYEALKEFLTNLIKKDIQYYVNGTHTSFCESFHSLCNKLCPKALIKSFDMYCMRKECAVIQWNLKKFADMGLEQFIKVPYRIWIAEMAVDVLHGRETAPTATLDADEKGAPVEVSSESGPDSEDSDSDD